MFPLRNPFYRVAIALAVWFVAGGARADSLAGRIPQSVAALVDLQLSPWESELWRDAADGQLDQHSLVAAALIASGVDQNDRLAAYLDRYEGFARSLDTLHTIPGPRQRAAELLKSLHRNLLTGRYQADASSMLRLFERGDYNCISSLILFVDLAQRAGLTVEAVEIPGHAFARLQAEPGRWIRVETTSSDWFDAVGDAWREQSALEHLVDVAVDRSRQSRVLSPVGMIATLYYNRGVELLERQEYSRALSVNALAMAMDSTNATAYGNLLASVNNWSLELCNRGDFSQAIQLLRRGMEVAPNHENFRVNYVAVHERWLIQLCLQQRHHEALSIADRLLAESPQHEEIRLLRLDVLLRWAESLTQRGLRSEALAVLDKARREYPGRSEPIEAAERIRRQSPQAPARLTGSGS